MFPNIPITDDSIRALFVESRNVRVAFRLLPVTSMIPFSKNFGLQQRSCQDENIGRRVDIIVGLSCVWS